METSVEYKNALADYGASLITHIGLVDAAGTELPSGFYVRRAVVWAQANNGIARPSADLVFDVPAGATVGGWRGFSALIDGINYCGKDLAPERFGGAGQYTLVASGTGIGIG